MAKAVVGTYKLGTALRILSIINENTATTATITLKDPDDTIVTGVDEANMTKAVDKTYQYIWQSTEYDDGGKEGEYKAIVKITIGAYTGVSETHFMMERTT